MSWLSAGAALLGLDGAKKQADATRYAADRSYDAVMEQVRAMREANAPLMEAQATAMPVLQNLLSRYMSRASMGGHDPAMAAAHRLSLDGIRQDVKRGESAASMQYRYSPSQSLGARLRTRSQGREAEARENVGYGLAQTSLADSRLNAAQDAARSLATLGASGIGNEITAGQLAAQGAVNANNMRASADVSLWDDIGTATGALLDYLTTQKMIEKLGGGGAGVSASAGYAPALSNYSIDPYEEAAKRLTDRGRYGFTAPTVRFG